MWGSGVVSRGGMLGAGGGRERGGGAEVCGWLSCWRGCLWVSRGWISAIGAVSLYGVTGEASDNSVDSPHTHHDVSIEEIQLLPRVYKISPCRAVYKWKPPSAKKEITVCGICLLKLCLISSKCFIFILVQAVLLHVSPFPSRRSSSTWRLAFGLYHLLLSCHLLLPHHQDSHINTRTFSSSRRLNETQVPLFK